MPLKKFTSQSSSALDRDFETFFYNYGLTVYTAQLLEGALGILIISSEALGLLEVDRSSAGIESVLDRCIGQNLKILEQSGLMDKEMKRMLKKANALRNGLVHRFVLDNIVDFSTPTGREAVNEKLQRVHSHLFLAHSVVQSLNNALLSKLGYDENWARERLKELQQDIPDLDVQPPDNPYESQAKVKEAGDS